MRDIQPFVRTALGSMLLSSLLVSTVVAEDLRGVYNLAKSSDTQFQAAGYNLEANREIKPLARSALLPQVFLSGSTVQGDSDSYGGSYGTSSLQLDLTQPLFRRDDYLAYQQADNVVAQSEAQYDAEKQGLIVRVAQAYFNVLAQEDNLEFTRAETKAIYNQLDQAKQRYDVGLIAITDVHEAQASYDNARSRQIQAKNGLDNARDELRVIVGMDVGKLAKLKPSIPLKMPNPSNVDYWSNQALANNPYVQASNEEVEIARQEIEVQKSGHYPTLDLFASKSEVWDSPASGLNISDEMIGLQMTLPIYTGGAVSSNVRKSRHQMNAAMQNHEGQKRAATRQVVDAYLGVESAISQVKALTASNVSAQSALNATEAGYEVGNRTLVDVLIAQQNLYQARKNLAAARYLYVLNGLYLRQAAGTLSETDLDRVNELLR